MLLAASTQRTIGLVILAIVLVGGLVYVLVNIRSARGDLGSEIDLASNRRPYLSDEELEGSKLDMALGSSLVLLAITAIALPVYWLGEPGRHEGQDANTDHIFTLRGEDIYIEGAQCVNCHGPEGSGGSAPIAITTESGEFVAQVAWKAPALNTVLARFTEDEVLHTLNYGRNGVMAAWGGGGGGPLTDQQLEELVYYIRSIQISEEDMRDEVSDGVEAGVEDLLLAESQEPWAVEVRQARQAKDAAAWALTLAGRETFGFSCADNPDLGICVADRSATEALTAANAAAAEPLAAAVQQWLAEAAAVRGRAHDQALADDASLADPDNAEQWRNAALELLSTPGAVEGDDLFRRYGEILFANEAANGTYSCARCHTYGWSFDAAGPYTVEINGTDEAILADGYNHGGGFFGPNLTGGSTREQFETAGSHAAFIESGQTIGATYGRGGSGGNGQMPGYGAHTEDSPAGPTFGNDDVLSYPGMLTAEQIDAIVAFERNL